MLQRPSSEATAMDSFTLLNWGTECTHCTQSLYYSGTVSIITKIQILIQRPSRYLLLLSCDAIAMKTCCTLFLICTVIIAKVHSLYANALCNVNCYCYQQGGTKRWSAEATLHENLSCGRKSWPPTYAVLSRNQLCRELRALIVCFSWPPTYAVLSRNCLCCELRA